ncbi:hypothetical protein DSO57_1038639 [Entomophthora muscae]|uniref:Uncharacterized protein n=1 Tax=Entomophthora muscae TaxID=34485 RepID=A0ACC2RDD7_9FUNG|nr:hypothetical protein DSO57_1038639 [Entomophthora muscae]
MFSNKHGPTAFINSSAIEAFRYNVEEVDPASYFIDKYCLADTKDSLTQDVPLISQHNPVAMLTFQDASFHSNEQEIAKPKKPLTKYEKLVKGKFLNLVALISCQTKCEMTTLENVKTYLKNFVHTVIGVATKITSLPANVSHNTQGALDEPPHDISNCMDQSDGKVELQVLSPN